MNLFEQVKQQVNLLDVIAFYTEDGLKEAGTNTFEMSDKTCPLCGHRDCFKVKFESETECFFKCFSCQEHGDAIKFVQELNGLEAVEAARLIAKDFKLKIVERRLSTEERVLHAASEYYHSRLLDAPACEALGGQTPLEYQTRKRHHKVGTLVEFSVGFADGKLCDYLQSVNFTPADIVSSGLGIVSSYTNSLVDYFGENMFVYPMWVDGVVSHISRKDPCKGKEYQLSKKFRRNDIIFYNQDSVKKHEKVYIVEGENDLLSLFDYAVDGAFIATCGSVGGPHESWLEKNCHGKQVFTLFDADDAGDVYREKIAALFPNAVHLRLPGPEKDIDDYLGAGRLFGDVFNYAVKVEGKKKKVPSKLPPSLPESEASVSVPQYDSDIGVMERDKCYYKIKHDKEGNEQLVQLTDFVISLRSTFVVDGKRNREAIFERQDGYKSKPSLIDSDTKVSLKSFKSRVADACDGSFFGTEIDLMNIWRFLYKKSAQRVVNIPDHVGRLSGSEEGDWLFSNVYVRRDGEIITPDKNGVMWINGNTKGVRPKTLSATLDSAIYSDQNKDVPKLTHDLSREEAELVERVFCHMYAQNLGDPGKALTLIGWAYMNAFSDKLFEKYRFIPFLFGWGGFGSGKTTLLEWLLCLYGMRQYGYSTLPNLKSGVGMERKLAYYASLPVCVDELRAGKEMTEFSGRFRSWYNRAGRAMGAANSTKEIVQQEVKSNFIFGGQDIFTDDALRQRTLVVRIGKENRDLKESYRVLQRLDVQGKLSSIGYGWIQESLKQDYEKLYAEVDALSLELIELGATQRSALVWAMVGVFSIRLGSKYFPQFDTKKYLLESCRKEEEVQSENNFLTRFFETVEGLVYKEHSELNVEHFKVDDDKLYVWFQDLFRVVIAAKRDQSEEYFTKEAIKSALKEEAYFHSDHVVTKMGQRGTSRRALVFDLTKPCPESLKNIAKFARDNL